MMTLKERLFAKWVVCKTISDKKSVQYGLKFSYPVYILTVLTGVYLENITVMLIATLIAFLAIKLPLHPFDYLYNIGISKFNGQISIPGRGSELQVNSIIAVIFNVVVIALISFNITVNYSLLAIIYALCSMFFIIILLFKD